MQKQEFDYILNNDFSVIDAKKFIDRNKKIKGYRFSVQQGLNVFPLKISGTAKMMLGLSAQVINALQSEATRTTVSFKLNQELGVEETSLEYLLKNRENAEEYIFFPRPLNGSDNIELQLIAPQNVTFDLFFTIIWI
jgi:hypothetical protein